MSALSKGRTLANLRYKSRLQSLELVLNTQPNHLCQQEQYLTWLLEFKNSGIDVFFWTAKCYAFIGLFPYHFTKALFFDISHRLFIIRWYRYIFFTMDYYVNVDSFGISPWNTFIFYLYVVIFSLAWIWLLKCCKSRNFFNMLYIHVIWSFTFVIYVISMLFKLYVLLHIYCIFICICIFNLLYISALTLFDFKFMR